MRRHAAVLRRALALVASLGALCWAGAAGAAASCTVSITALAFGTFVGAQLNNTATATVDCGGIGGNAFIPLTIAVNGGGGTIAARRLVNGANQLSYQIYTDAARSIVWGNGTTGSTVAGSASNTVNSVHTVYGRVPAATTPPTGTYTDTLTFTVTF